MPNSSAQQDYAERILDRTTSMLAYWDAELRCRYANRAYETWFGKSSEQLVGTTLDDLLGPELFSLNAPYIRRALEGEPQVFERTIRGPDGVERHSLARYHPDVVDGKVLGFIAEVAEVSMLKELQAALQLEVKLNKHMLAALNKKEKALEAAQLLGKMGSWEWEIQPDITTWSSGLYRLFGLDPRQLPPAYAEHAKLYTPASWRQLQEAVAAALTAGTPYLLDLEYCRADGTTGWLEVRGEAERDASGRITSLHGTALDITDNRALLNALDQQMCRVEHALDAAELGIWRWTGASGELFWENQRARDMFGVGADESGVARGDLFFAERIHHEDREAFKNASAAFFNGETDLFHFQGRFSGKAGARYRWIDCIGQKLANDRMTRTMICTVRNVTEQVATRQGLMQSMSESKAVNDRHSSFLFSLAHEIRNCIAPLSNGLQLLQKKYGDGESKKTAQVMSKQLSHITRLVDDIYDIRRLQTNELGLRFARVSLNDVVRSAVDMCESNIVRKRQQLVLRLPKSDVWIRGDGVRLTQVLVNLLANACKFTPMEGEIRLVLTVDREGLAVVNVIDTGIGMAADALESIFELYQRVGDEASAASGGLGIGLYLVKQLVELHGGSVRASSEGIGKGTRFIIRLPLAT